jgi:mRNA interferase MazF
MPRLRNLARRSIDIQRRRPRHPGRRGELWTAAAAEQGSAGKPRPILIVQDDCFEATESITVCPLTTTTADIPLLRIPLQPTQTNGLTTPWSVMLDKITPGRPCRSASS